MPLGSVLFNQSSRASRPEIAIMKVADHIDLAMQGCFFFGPRRQERRARCSPARDLPRGQRPSRSVRLAKSSMNNELHFSFQMRSFHQKLALALPGGFSPGTDLTY
eukprot:570450-Pleurochrysis_carterae.AAC.4